MKLICTLLAIASIIVCACTKGETNQQETSLLNGIDSINVPYTWVTDSFALPTANTYSININPPTATWLNIKVGAQNHLVVTVQENKTTEKRTAQVTVTSSNGQTKKVTVIQQPYAGPLLEVSKKVVNLNGTLPAADTLHITANVGWTISKPPNTDWFSIDKLSGSGNAQIIVNASLENSNTARTATITITPAAGYNLTAQTIEITQRPVTLGLNWDKKFGSSNLDFFYATIQAHNSGYIAVGSVRIQNGNGANAWMVKTDNNGNTIWEKKYGGTKGDEINSVAATNDGGYILAGFATSSDGDLAGHNVENGDVWIIKTDALGNKTWSRTFGGNDFEMATGIVQTQDGGYVFCGSTNSNNGHITTSYGKKDMWVVKLDATGNMQWQKSFGGAQNDEATAIVADAEGNLIVSGTTGSTNGHVQGFLGGSSDGWVLKLNSSGNILWSKTVGGVFADEANAVTLTPGGNYAVAGYTSSYVPGWRYNGDYLLTVLDKNGNLLLERAIGSFEQDKAYGIASPPDGGYVLTGYTTSSGGDVSGPKNGNKDVWVVKLNAAGNPVWNKSFGGPGNNNGTGIIATGNNTFILSGYHAASVTNSQISYLVQKGWLMQLQAQ